MRLDTILRHTRNNGHRDVSIRMLCSSKAGRKVNGREQGTASARHGKDFYDTAEFYSLFLTVNLSSTKTNLAPSRFTACCCIRISDSGRGAIADVRLFTPFIGYETCSITLFCYLIRGYRVVTPVQGRTPNNKTSNKNV